MDAALPVSSHTDQDLATSEVGLLAESPSATALDQSPNNSEFVKLSVIIPLYNVARYLPEFLKSLDDQKIGRYENEYIFVDDGSPDESAALVEDWLTRTTLQGQLLTKVNGGVGSARNLGIEYASGEWFTFPDPDDILQPTYFAKVADFILSKRGRQAHVVAANVIRYFDDTGEIRDTHALRFKFKGKEKNVNLVRSPHYIHLMVTSGFMRAAHFRWFGLRFSETLKLSEDGNLVSELLSKFEEPILGLVPNAVYLYRKRSSQDSALDTQQASPGALLNRWTDGYIPLFERVMEERGAIPEWLANVVLYEFKWLFGAETNPASRNTVFTEEQRQIFIQIVRKILSPIADETIRGFRVASMSLEVKLVLLAIKGSFIRNGQVNVTELDQNKQLVQLKYFFSGPLPVEEYYVRAKSVAPVAAKVRQLQYFGQDSISERIVWLPANSWLRVDIDGLRQQLVLGVLGNSAYALTEREIWTHFDRSRPTPPRAVASAAVPAARPQSVYRQARRVARMTLERFRTISESLDELSMGQQNRRENNRILRIGRAARSRRSVRLYGDAWVFVDRIDQAQDSAEHLYRHIAGEHPNINVWFAIQRSTSDWSRLKREGFKLVAYRSSKHVKLMLNAKHLISSHIDADHVNPIDSRLYRGKRQWKFSFLQHGVTKDDLSTWLNQKPISLFVTSTRPEFESITSDHTGYVLTTKEVVLAGMPRHDALLQKKRQMSGATPTPTPLLLIAPTWRNSLLAPRTSWDAPRALIQGFAESEYARAWFGLLNSIELRAIAAEHDLQVAFLPHPGLQPHIQERDVPEHVKLLRYSEHDIQKLIVSSKLLVTDYSSLAFESAYLDSPVVYFHFENRKSLSSGHTYNTGYFDYHRDGFGPVATTIAGVVAAVGELANSEGIAPEPYRSRAEATFEFRDGNCSERVYQAIALLDVPHPPV